MRKFLPLVLVGLVGASLVAGHQVRTRIGIEFTPESLLGWVDSLGWKGPAVFLLLVTFRQFLLLPSPIILPVGGLCFGAVTGTLLGAAGIAVSALMKFGLARWLGRGWLRSQLGPSFEPFERRVAAAGPVVVGVVTAHPMGVMSPFHWAAGLSSIPLLGFAVAVGVASPIRAGAYAFLGSTLLDWGSPRFFLATAVLVAVIVVPLLHPAVRRRIPLPQLSGPESRVPRRRAARLARRRRGAPWAP